MRYQTHVLALVFAGILLGVGSFIITRTPIRGIALIAFGILFYLYGYRIKR